MEALSEQLEELEREGGGQADEELRAKLNQLQGILGGREATAQSARAAAESQTDSGAALLHVQNKLGECERQMRHVEENLSPEAVELLAQNLDLWQPAVFPTETVELESRGNTSTDGTTEK